MKLIDLKWWGGSAANAPPPTNHRYWLMDQTIGARFWAKVNCAGTHQAGMATCCWEWEGASHPRGYGKIYDGTRMTYAHRVALEWVLGRPPIGYVLHKCDNPRCLRPSHLEEGDQAENLRQCRERGRNNKGEVNGRSKLTADIVREIRRQVSAGLPRPVLARQYGITEAYISTLVNRKRWSHIE